MTDARIDGRRAVVRLASIDDRTAADALRGRLLFVAAADAEPPPPGGHYVHDLIGCEVRTREGGRVGVVEDVLSVPGQDLWAVRTGTGLCHIPAVRRFIVSVDTARRLVVVDLPDGLIGEE